jgi:hypothetical protein
MGQGVRGAFNTTRNSSLECDYTPLFLVLISKFLKKIAARIKKSGAGLVLYPFSPLHRKPCQNHGF